MAIIGLKSKIETVGASSLFETAAVGVTDFTIPSVTVSEVETTDMNDDSETFLPAGTINLGEFQATIRHASGQESSIAAAAADGTIYTWKITLSDTSTVQFKGFIKQCLGSTVPLKGVVDSTVIIKVAQALTATDGSTVGTSISITPA